MLSSGWWGGSIGMDHGFIAKPLARRQIDQAFPLVRTVLPALDVDRWRAFASALTGLAEAPAAPCGIMTAQNGHGYIHGLFSYATGAHLSHGRLLSVENFIVLDLIDVSGAADALLHAMESVARMLGCGAIHTSLSAQLAAQPGARAGMLEHFRAAGHAVEARGSEALRLFKRVERANDNPSGGSMAGGTRFTGKHCRA